MNRYNQIDYILSLDFEEGLEQIEYAINQKKEDLLFFRWAICNQSVSFDKFKESIGINKVNANMVKKEEDVTSIINNTKNILNSFK